MSSSRLGRLPVFWQILLLLLASLAIAQAIGLLLLFVLPPPRPDFNRLGDIAAVLSGNPREERRGGGDHERDLSLHPAPSAPEQPAAMTSDPGLTRLLAERLGRAPADVRLFFEPDRRDPPFLRRHRRSGVDVRHGETLFFTPLVAAMRDGAGWRVTTTPPPPLIAPWQRRQMLWFGVSALVLLPLVWFFARALTEPIRRFAEAADRLGADPGSPAVAEEGPAELRTTARALNGMQGRLTDYVGERTAMIGAIAHDLRTPLARIAFRVETAPEPMREKVLADVEQMRAMLAATIGFVRQVGGSGPRGPVALGALAGQLVTQERELGRPVALDATADVVVTGDPLALHRLLQNLVDNGIAYAGAVEIAVAVVEGQAEVLVADRGPGLAPDLLPRVFQPFVRGDPSRNRATGGIGLGLTIARTIAEDHGGTLVLRPREGGGLEAVLRLPLA